jgi:hypothetical protein
VPLGDLGPFQAAAEWSTSFVIPGRDEVASPESITTIMSMDSGLALRAPRNDEEKKKGPLE